MIIRDVTFEEFEKETKNDDIVCVGCGKLLEDFLKYKNKEYNKRVKLLVDGKKCGERKSIDKKEWYIGSYCDLEKKLNDNTSILITSMWCKDIVDELNKTKKTDNIKCYLYTIMSMKTREYKFPCVDSCGREIPKIIHWFWFGGNDVPYSLKENIENWRRVCPDYEIIKWSEDNYDISKNAYMKEAYSAKRYGFVPDYARLDVVYKMGGIYLDTDVEIKKSFDDLLCYRSFFGFQRNFYINTGHGFGSVKGNRIIKDLMDVYKGLHFIENNGQYNLKASPEYTSEFFARYGVKFNNSIQTIGDNVFLPTDVFDPKGSSAWAPRLTSNTHGIHHYSESWVNGCERNEVTNRYKQVMYFLGDDI